MLFRDTSIPPYLSSILHNWSYVSVLFRFAEPLLERSNNFFPRIIHFHQFYNIVCFANLIALLRMIQLSGMIMKRASRIK